MSKSSRRAFLTGGAARDTIADALTPPAEPLPAPVAATGVQPGSHLLSVSREAMACLFEIVFDAGSYRHCTDVAVAALDVVDALEGQLTVYRETSEVMQINRQAAIGRVRVERGLFELLKRAVTLSEATGGAFDVAAGALTKVWGFFRRQGAMPRADDIAAALAVSGTRHLLLHDEDSSVEFSKPTVELNLGAIGKGYALDKAADALALGGIDQFLIHGGNSSVLGRGEREWTVALRHPLKPDVRLAEFVLRDQALGTSGSGTQSFHHLGKRYGHIIDPRTGWPADQALSATVIAPTAEQADALSTAFYVLGLEGAAKYCAEHPEISALLCQGGKTAAGVELFPIGLSDEAWRRH
jgi:FAD:protein FMN transferase